MTVNESQREQPNENKPQLDLKTLIQVAKESKNLEDFIARLEPYENPEKFKSETTGKWAKERHGYL